MPLSVQRTSNAPCRSRMSTITVCAEMGTLPRSIIALAMRGDLTTCREARGHARAGCLISSDYGA